MFTPKLLMGLACLAPATNGLYFLLDPFTATDILLPSQSHSIEFTVCNAAAVSEQGGNGSANCSISWSVFRAHSHPPIRDHRTDTCAIGLRPNLPPAGPSVPAAPAFTTPKSPPGRTKALVSSRSTCGKRMSTNWATTTMPPFRFLPPAIRRVICVRTEPSPLCVRWKATAGSSIRRCSSSTVVRIPSAPQSVNGALTGLLEPMDSLRERASLAGATRCRGKKGNMRVKDETESGENSFCPRFTNRMLATYSITM